jgi:hypothetical protein
MTSQYLFWNMWFYMKYITYNRGWRILMSIDCSNISTALADGTTKNPWFWSSLLETTVYQGNKEQKLRNIELRSIYSICKCCWNVATVNGHKYSSPSIIRYIFHIKPHVSKQILWTLADGVYTSQFNISELLFLVALIDGCF